MNLYNGRPSRNKRYVPNVRYILDRLNKLERLAISPKLNDKVEVEMKTVKGCEVTCDNCIDADSCSVPVDDRIVQGDQDIFNDMGKEDPREVYKDDLEGIEVGPKCPTCDLNTQFHNGVETCPVHGPVVIEN